MPIIDLDARRLAHAAQCVDALHHRFAALAREGEVLTDQLEQAVVQLEAVIASCAAAPPLETAAGAGPPSLQPLDLPADRLADLERRLEALVALFDAADASREEDETPEAE